MMKLFPILASLSLLVPATLPADEAAQAEGVAKVTEASVAGKESPPEEKQAKEPKPSVLTFADETRITGFPQSIDAGKGSLTMNSPSLQGTSVLRTDQLLEMTLAGTPDKLESDHFAIATLKPHFSKKELLDSIRGRLVRLDEKEVVLDTWYAGRLTLQRQFVKSLDIYRQSPTFYEGPDGPEGWVASSGDLDQGWTFKNRTMISKGSIGAAREIEIPEKAKITFTADWKNSTYFRIFFFSPDGKRTYPSSGYSLTVQRTYISLYRYAKNPRSTDIISESIRSLYSTESATFTIYLDRSKKGTNAVYIDQTEIGTWTGTDDTEFKGNWLHFVPRSENPVRFSKISVAQWDGILPAKKEKKDNDEPKAEEGQEIRLANGDVVMGNVQGIEEGIASLESEFGKISIPIQRMRSVGLVTKRNQIKMQTNDVRAWFHEGGFVTIDLKSLDSKTLTGYSQAWGTATFDLNAFSRIEFNIWMKKLDTQRYGTSDW